MEQLFLPLHLLSLAYVAWNIVHADHMGLNWMRGKVKVLNEAKVHMYHRGSWIGLALMFVTGLALFWPMREFLLTRPEFYTKMAFVVTLICNGVLIGNLKNKATMRTFASLSIEEKIPLFLSGAVSTISWLGAAVMAFFLIPD